MFRRLFLVAHPEPRGPGLELEEDYLARLDLLTDAEHEWLAEHQTDAARSRARSLDWHTSGRSW
jgi:hypothetical protein